MLEEPRSFEAAFEIQVGDSVWRRIAFTTLNWLETNKEGMTFGILLGADLLGISDSSSVFGTTDICVSGKESLSSPDHFGRTAASCSSNLRYRASPCGPSPLAQFSMRFSLTG